jgi:hypothetical protein
MTPVRRLVYQRRHRGPFFERTFISVLQMLLAAATFTVAFLFFYYWVHDHNYNGYWPAGSDLSIT